MRTPAMEENNETHCHDSSAVAASLAHAEGDKIL
jgi:hypothetical protein